MRGRLVACRVLIAGFAAVYTSTRLHELWAIAHLPAAQLEQTGLARFAVPPVVVLACAIVAIAACGVFAAGRWPHVTGPIAALAFVYVFSVRSAYGQIFHTENLVALHLCALAIAAFYDDPKGAVRLLALLTVATYVLAGIAKLRLAGTAWLDGDQLRNQIAVDNLRKALLGGGTAPLATPLLDHPALLAPLSIATLVVELAAPIALLGGRWAVAWVTTAWVFHVGVLLMMWIVFPYPLAGLAFVPLLPVERLRKRLPW
ncbi:MAG: hypothetical protein JO257_15595 [Deltaproteobacteria bacterium]|nr:hypothetical protein [Deltaproteobacteria bacterium]